MRKHFPFVAAILIATLTGCAKYQLLPDDAVDDTFENTKQLYNEHKLKKSGAKQREFSLVLDSDSATLKTNSRNCFRILAEQAKEQSSRPPAIVKESSRFDKKTGTLECGIVAYIWPIQN